MNHACIDATVILKWVLPEEMNYTAARMYQAGRYKHLNLCAPACVGFRVVQALLRWVDAGCLSKEEGRQAMQRLGPLLEMVEPVSLEGREDEGYIILVGDEQRWIYDRGFLAVAQARACDLWTADKELAMQLAPVYGSVRWLGEFN